MIHKINKEVVDILTPFILGACGQFNLSTTKLMRDLNFNLTAAMLISKPKLFAFNFQENELEILAEYYDIFYNDSENLLQQNMEIRDSNYYIGKLNSDNLTLIACQATAACDSERNMGLVAIYNPDNLSEGKTIDKFNSCLVTSDLNFIINLFKQIRDGYK